MFVKDWLYSRNAFWVVLLVLLGALLFQLGAWGVLETSEARYAEISREMLASGDWLHPRLLGILHYHKPPLTYMITAVGMAVFGVNEFGARFFLQVSFVVQAGLVYGLGCLLFKSRKVAMTALIIYVTLPAALISARNLTTDSFLATFELLAIWAWVKFKLQGKPGFLFLFFIALALAFLTKGPVGLLFPVMVMMAFANSGGYKAGKGQWMLGLLIFLGLGSSWYVYLMLQDQRFVDYFLFRQTVERFANPEAFNRSKPWWYYLVLAPVLSLPWSVMLGIHFRKLWDLVPLHRKLFGLWILVPLLFFSLSGSKLILYILPLFAGLALLMAWLLSELTESQRRNSVIIGFLFYGCMSLALLSAPLLPVGVALSPGAFLFPVLSLLVLLYLGQSLWENNEKLLLGALSFTLFLVPFSTYLLSDNAALLPGSEHVAAALKEKGLAKRQVVVYDQLLPSLAFEQKRTIVSLYDSNKGLQRETQFENSEAWRCAFLQCGNAQDSTALVKLLAQKPVVMVKGKLPPNRKWLLRAFTKTKQVGPWNLHY
ncbi:hypothetical protein TH63_09175 [Rufibacter radiotolerans]|uniref:Glycosyltransferase RgtA/B/C/D-like domain-containing protein n=1 Tax=Rufibacter radiotolerans TaxID=1379910 RepID=A0A0H4VPC0_9BACT|nr:glycosyltransferase family 39 protein [Rufibacter radiotolerans]AKQ45782.1 hypothetical protein TH63_09175 [Rufibacter radiotolerans]